MRRTVKDKPECLIADIFSIYHAQCLAKAIVIPTNGDVRKRDDRAVMGRGLARCMAVKFPEFPYKLGYLLVNEGNHVYYFRKYHVVTFPVKEHWSELASYALIRRSCRELLDVMDRYNIGTVYVPRVGCGNGGRAWSKVKPILVQELNDRCVLVTMPSDN